MNELKDKLEELYKTYDKRRLSPDPLEFLHLYSEPEDIEIAGILSAIFAYGRISQFELVLKKLHEIMNHQPYNFIKNYSIEDDSVKFHNIKYRFYTESDIIVLFFVLRKVYDKYGSLHNLFREGYNPDDKNIKRALYNFSITMSNIAEEKIGTSRALRFMFPDPFKNSACKRINLFLRWMVRKDELDFGLWDDIPTSKLVIPVDTHVAKISRKLQLTGRKNISWSMAEEITEKLKMFDANDPVKYDFALCHIGVRNENF